MSWLFSRALVEEFSAATCSDGARSALSSGTPTPRAFLPPDRMTDYSRPSRFGMTFGPLTDALGAELLTWFREASRVRTSASQGRAPALTASDPACGPKWRGSLAKYDPATCSWRTAQLSLLGDSDGSSVTWPRWGTTVGGELYLLPMPAHLTSGRESGLLPTPRASDATRGDCPSERRRRSPSLVSINALNWPTPTACMSKGSSPASLTRKTGRSRENDRLDHKVMALDGGSLNPTWVEWLMGWPLGWTDLQPLATAKSLSAQPLRGAA